MQEIIDERAVEIDKVNKGIVELNNMFLDLSVIVKEQQVRNHNETVLKNKTPANTFFFTK